LSIEHPVFSVIVPTLQEEDEIQVTLAHARIALGADCEMIVVDGGSSDRTVDLARSHARVISTAPCRGAQLAAGAAGAGGDILIFLHADTWLGPGAGPAIRQAVGAGATSGCFTLAFREPGSVRLRALALGINLRTRVFRTATGDQAIFATREAYRASGGVPEIPIFEDVRFARRLRDGGNFQPLPERAVTSPRRWDRDGFLRTTGRHLWLRLLHALGADPNRLATRYSRR
jgi:rSAM/selenodomain-associated transferase 2